MKIYSINILSVGLSVRLQNAKELRYLWMLSSLFYYVCFAEAPDEKSDKDNASDNDVDDKGILIKYKANCHMDRQS